MRSGCLWPAVCLSLVASAALPAPAAEAASHEGAPGEPAPFPNSSASSSIRDSSSTQALSFPNQVLPLLDRLGCSAAECHGASRGRGGLRLSLFGAYPREDHAALTRAAGGRRVNRVEPSSSLLLEKLTGALPHAGARRIEPGSPEHAVLVSWIASGAPWGDEAAARPALLETAPGRLTIEKGRSADLAVTALYSDGTRANVTAGAVYRSTDPAVASCDAAGQVTAVGCGRSAIVATYLRRSAVVHVLVPQTLPFPFPDGAYALPGVPTVSRIDQLVLDWLKELSIPPSGLSSDSEFLRRVYLDTIGLLPTPEEVRDFLSDPAADEEGEKRRKCIDRLLEREEFADFWALKWGDLLRIKSEYPSNLWPNAVQAYHRWVRESIARSMPYDRFARELLTSTGSDFRVPTANYFRALPKRDPQAIAEVTALTFMGARIGCARCHGHPTEDWTLEDNLGMAAFFAKVRFKATQEWKEEIVYVDPEQVLRHPATGRPVAPKLLGGSPLDLAPEEDPRRRLADWLTSPENPWFARNIVNRIWCWLLGRGIVHEPDDLRPTNPPIHPELLAYLEGELISHRYDLKHVFRLILNSRMYQLSSKATEWNVRDMTGFSHRIARRLEAEQLLDAIGQVTETSEEYMSRIPEPFTYLPGGFRATQLWDGSVGTPFLELFGRPPRDSAYESERCSRASMPQALHMINSSHLEGRIAKSPRIQRLLRDGKGDREIVEEIYLAALSRFPSDAETSRALEYLGREPRARRQALQDLVWAVLNTKEFLLCR